MANTKEIRTQIKSIKSTKQITKAMEMVAASKMHKAQERMKSSRPYYSRIKEVISHVLAGKLEFEHDFLQKRPVANSGYIIISSDRGLCGGLNNNLFRKFLKQDGINWEQKKPHTKLCTIGKKAQSTFANLGFKIEASASDIGDKPSLSAIIGAIQAMIESYREREIDELYLVYNQFVNTMTQEPVIEKLLPIENNEHLVEGMAWDYIYEPKSPKILNLLIQRYIESLAYQSVVENIACEQAARMIAMKNATDNAEGLISDLNLAYNKARQASITKELSEIVAGADAV